MTNYFAHITQAANTDTNCERAWIETESPWVTKWKMTVAHRVGALWRGVGSEASHLLSPLLPPL